MALEVNRPLHDHLSERAVEDYAAGRLPKAELESFEEHLLLCEHCQERLDEEDDFAAAVRSLAGIGDFAPVRAVGSAPSLSLVHRTGLRWWPVLPADSLRSRRWTTPAWGTAVMLAVGIGAGMAVWKFAPVRSSIEAADPVTLIALRGGDGTAQVRALHPLELSIELPSEASGAGGSLPEAESYRLEMVDAAGVLQWAGTAQPVAEKLTARMGKRLREGAYWVRLYAPSGKLLREFGLRLT